VLTNYVTLCHLGVRNFKKYWNKKDPTKPDKLPKTQKVPKEDKQTETKKRKAADKEKKEKKHKKDDGHDTEKIGPKSKKVKKTK